ncbi:MAG: hypothetical protein IJQ95_04030 [Paludibacteraceae bacterium]|nr:hypothetical protein [Paludibacteraceae bacterium]
MKKIIKIVLYLCLGVCLVSCSNEEDLKVSSQKKECVNQQSFTTNDISGVMDKLNELNLTYGINPAHRMLKRSPTIPSNLTYLPDMSDWQLTMSGSGKGWQIAKEDGMGAAAGACGGAAFGSPGGPTAVIGATIGAVVLGVIASIAAAQVDTAQHCMAVIESPMLYNSLPGSINIEYVPEEHIPSGMEIGRYHNALCAYIMETNALSNACSIDDIYDIVVENVDDGLDSYFSTDDLDAMQSYFMGNRDVMLSHMQVNIDSYLDSIGMATEHEILKHYTYSVVSTETYFNLHAYTLDYINIINSAQQTGILTEESALCINAYISTFESSKELWNLATPNPYVSDLFILCSTTGDWYVAKGITEYEELISERNYAFVGFPVFSNGTLTRVYIKEDFSYNTEVASAFISNIFTTNSIAIQEAHLYYQQYGDYITGGTYELHTVAGYEDSYKYIDFAETY